jgi:hypothetical protein
MSGSAIQQLSHGFSLAMQLAGRSGASFRHPSSMELVFENFVKFEFKASYFFNKNTPQCIQ